MTCYILYPNLLNRLKRIKKLHSLKSEPSQTKWCKPFDFPINFVEFERLMICHAASMIYSASPFDKMTTIHFDTKGF